MCKNFRASSVQARSCRITAEHKTCVDFSQELRAEIQELRRFRRNAFLPQDTLSKKILYLLGTIDNCGWCSYISLPIEGLAVYRRILMNKNKESLCSE